MKQTTETAYEKACKKLGRTPLTIENFAHEAERNRKQCFGEHKFRTCIEAANMNEDGTLFKYDQASSMEAYELWYLKSKDSKRPSGVGFVFGFSCYGCVGTCLGSRLLAKSRAIAAELGRDTEVTEYFCEWRGV